jgi:hypothetical protein
MMMEYLQICADVLGIPSVAPGENFFDLGGDSILAVVFIERIVCAGASAERASPFLLFECESIGEFLSLIAE